MSLTSLSRVEAAETQIIELVALCALQSLCHCRSVFLTELVEVAQSLYHPMTLC